MKLCIFVFLISLLLCNNVSVYVGANDDNNYTLSKDLITLLNNEQGIILSIPNITSERSSITNINIDDTFASNDEKDNNNKVTCLYQGMCNYFYIYINFLFF